MPQITLSLDDDRHRALSDEYKRMSITWLRDKPDAPPPFEQWLATRLQGAAPVRHSDEVREELQTVDVIEKLVTALGNNGFALAQVDRREREDAAEALAEALAETLELSPPRARRLVELVSYYCKSAREVADAAHLGMTNRVYGTLHEAQRALTERTARGLDRLGPERAMGRVEGGLAILMLLQVMTRQAGREKAEEFRARLEQQS